MPRSGRPPRRALVVSDKEDEASTVWRPQKKKSPPKRRAAMNDRVDEEDTSSSSSETETSGSDREEKMNTAKGPRRRDHRSGNEILVEVCNTLRNAEDFKLTWVQLAAKVDLNSDRLKEIVKCAMQSAAGVPGFWGVLRESGENAKKKIGLHCSLGLCVVHLEHDFGCSGERCSCLHLCPNWLVDKCEQPEGVCNLGHNFDDAHNAMVIAAAGLGAVPHPVLHRLLSEKLWVPKDSSGNDFPHICPYYNSAQGCSLADEACPKLHLCMGCIPELVEGGKSCPACELNHSRYGANVHKLCAAWGIDVEDYEWRSQVHQRLKNMKWDPKEVKEVTRRLPHVAVSRPVPQSRPGDDGIAPTEKGDSKHAEICLAFLHEKCTKKPDCPDGFFHAVLPYQWQVYDNRSSKWLNFPLDQSDALENGFVNETITDQQLDDMDVTDLDASYKNLISLLSISDQNPSSGWTADFDSLTLTDSSASTAVKLRRLSTPVTLKSTDQWATKWRWFFSDKHGRWTEYGADAVEDANTNYRSDVTSDNLEQAYHDYLYNNGQPSVAFKTSKYPYEIYFNRPQLVQKNVDPQFNTERHVRRRPLAFSSLPSVGKAALNASNRPLHIPRRWTGVTKDANVATLVPVTSGSDEWNELVALVAKQFNFRPFVKAERIQNPTLYQQYSLNKNKLKVAYKNTHGGSTALAERKLLHPIHPQSVPEVLHKSIDWRSRVQLPYTTGQYGIGSYCYGPGALLTQPQSGQTWVIVDAYVGNPVKGDPGLTCVSPHRVTGISYECAADDDKNPTIFVFFSFQNIYPHYVLTF